MSDTGNGATLVLGTTGAIGDIQKMTLPQWVLDAIEDSHLGTADFKTFVPGDLADPGEISAEVIFDAEVAIPSLDGTVETVTITWPISGSGNTTNATLAGTAFLTAYQMPGMENSTLQVASVTIKFDGKTGPAFTVESA